MNIHDYYKTIENKKDFDFFLELLYNEFLHKHEYWENDTLESYLEALSGSNNSTTEEESKIEPTWSYIAELLLKAIVYE
ncbi:MAG: hypothetical protein CVV25_06730 [Ignavibacteriae bacterium HGW-Ignavibacteriae-4]|jgi:hypothetical protein|nr:MAG: hypothetical protein CVV25_06730 [Ignavibacteriae bacterium HGW-Ignavibacteriae-4]